MQQSKTTLARTGGIRLAGLPYLATALGIAAVTLCQFLYLPTFTGYPFQFYFPVVAIAALLFGTGIFAAILSGLAALFVFIPPHFSLAITSPDPVLALVTFGIGSLVIVLVISLLSRVANHYFRALGRTEREKIQTTAIMLQMHRRAASSFHDIAAAMAEPASEKSQVARQAAAQRFSAMGRLHDRLAMPRDAAVKVNARNFLERLCDDLQASLGGRHPVRLIPMIESCAIAQAQATVAGHLLSELIDDANRRCSARAPVRIAIDFTSDAGNGILMLIEQQSSPASTAVLRPERPAIATLLAQLQGSLERAETASPTFLIRFPLAPAATASS